MKTTAVRMYGAKDLRMEEFTLPELGEDEVLMKVVSDSLCTSTYKAVKQGSAHKRVPPDIAENPVIIGHEMCGQIVAVGSKAGDWKAGQKVVIQPALKLENNYDPGYSYPFIGGAATYVIVPKIVLERGCLLPFQGDSFFKGSLVEALGCIVRGYKGFYHTDYETYIRTDGAKKVCYTHLDLPMIAVDQLEELGKDNALYAELGRIVKENGGLWCAEAEAYLLANGPKL